MSNPKNWPQSVTAYKVTDHFQDILNDEQRHLEWSEIVETVSTGRRISNAGDADVAFQNYTDGMWTYVLAGWDHEGNERVLITAWHDLDHPILAKIANGWSDEQLEDIHDFNGHEAPLEYIYPYW